MKIVVIDDDDDVREVVRELLQAEGCSTAGAANGEEALRLLRGADWTPGLILLDLQMPIMDGWEFLRAIEEEPKLRRVPLAIMTARPGMRRLFEAGRGADGCTRLLLRGSHRLLLPKPLNLRGLVSIVRELRPS
jgi:CheY-like chemotaxis protein